MVAACLSPQKTEGDFLINFHPLKQNVMQVLVFKTNLTDRFHVSKVEPYLAVHPQIQRWNVDLQDCDNILRIETEQLLPVEVEKLVTQAGYYCEELE